MSHRPARSIVRRSRGLCIGFAIAGTLWGPAALDASELRHTATVKLVQEARPSIVNVHGQKTLAPADEGYRRGETQNVNGMGTGVIIDERGYILTNHHVIDGVKKIEVTLANRSDKETLIATRVAHDSKTDLAIIKIAVAEKLPVINVGTSSDLMIGEPVIAVGNAYGYEHTVTRGIISALHRTVKVSDSQDYKDLIQTDASINPGNSGGPLLNIDGEMIGINVAVRAGAQGIGFAIPVDIAISIAADLMTVERERSENTFHGIVSKQGGTNSKQCVVAKIDSESPAGKAGLRLGDVITAVEENPVARGLDIERALLGHQPGDVLELTVSGYQHPVTVRLTLSSAPGPLDRRGKSLGNPRAASRSGRHITAKGLSETISRRVTGHGGSPRQPGLARWHSTGRYFAGNAHLGDDLLGERHLYLEEPGFRLAATA